jgi:hypothetical protein
MRAPESGAAPQRGSATADLIGRYVEAGATDLTFYLHNPAEPILGDLVASHRMATRDQPERVATDVFAPPPQDERLSRLGWALLAGSRRRASPCPSS